MCFTRPRYQVSVYRTIDPLVTLRERLHTQVSFHKRPVIFTLIIIFSIKIYVKDVY